jgi:enamine deaminase RidA (YjgF/YER057c/UK114 family)
MSERERKLEQLGYKLDWAPSAGAIYRPVVVVDRLAFVSGCVPFEGEKKLASYGKGKVPSQVSVEDAKRAAQLCAANVLRLIKREVGSLDRVERMVKVLGFVNSDLDFTDHHLVINGASQLFVDVLGPEAGLGARSAVGMAQLPLGSSVEVEAILLLKAQ